MRRGRLVLILLLVLVLLLLCGALVYRFLSPAGLMGPAAQPTPETMETVTVVVTAQNIRRGQRITSELLATLEVPVQYVVETQILNPEEAVGKLAARDLPRGVFLTKGDLVETAADLLATGSVAALQIPPGYVAISIPITRLTSVSYAIQPGDRVGILVTLPFVDLDPEFQSRLPNLSASLVQNALLIGKGTEARDRRARGSRPRTGRRVRGRGSPADPGGPGGARGCASGPGGDPGGLHPVHHPLGAGPSPPGLPDDCLRRHGTVRGHLPLAEAREPGRAAGLPGGG